MSKTTSSLAYNITGTGIPVVLLHGFCEDASMWDDVLKQGYDGLKIITIDLPGFGKSAIAKSYSILNMAEEVHELLVSLESFLALGNYLDSLYLN